MPGTVVSELQALFNLAKVDDETQQDCARRLAIKANTISDADWETLDGPAQVWVNAALEAMEKKVALPLPTGIEEMVPEATEKPAEAAKPVKGKAKAPPAKKGAAKPPAKAAAVPKKAPAKAAKAAAPKAVKKATAGSARGPRGKFALTDKITLTKAENPFRTGTKCANWYAKYRDGMTVQEAIAAGVPRHHIRWDQTLGNVTIAP